MPEYIPLAFGLEALYPPMTMTAAQLRDIYVKLADPCRFSEFKQQGEGQGARLSESGNRHLTIAQDRIAYKDDFTQHMFTTFMEDMDRILKTMKEVFNLPVLIHTKVLIRLLMPFQGQCNTVEYFQQSLMNTAVPHFSQFGRPMSGVGVKLVFPPTQEFHSTFHLRIEPYFRDLKMFFLENNAQFFDPVVNFPDIKKRMEESYEFIREKAGPFVLDLSPPSP